jgi:hypothetical protein
MRYAICQSIFSCPPLLVSHVQAIQPANTFSRLLALQYPNELTTAPSEHAVSSQKPSHCLLRQLLGRYTWTNRLEVQWPLLVHASWFRLMCYSLPMSSLSSVRALPECLREEGPFQGGSARMFSEALPEWTPCQRASACGRRVHLPCVLRELTPAAWKIHQNEALGRSMTSACWTVCSISINVEDE